MDPLAAAAAAVNAVVWGLGPRVVVACGDALGDPHVAERAAAAQARLRSERDELLGRVAVFEAVRDAKALVELVLAAGPSPARAR